MKNRNIIAKTRYPSFIFLALFLPWTSVPADEFSSEIWQIQRLFSPSKEERRADQSYQVVIYSGLKDLEVERAMDKQFDRLQSFMFANIVVTDENGNPVKDPETGLIKTESDDC